MVALALCPSPSQSAVSEYGWSSTSFGVVSTHTGGHRYCSHCFGAVEIWGVHESGMGPYLSRVRRKCPPFTGLYPPRTALGSLNQSTISQRDWGFLTVQGGVDPKKLGLLLRLMEVLEMWNDLWTGDGTLYPPEVEQLA